MNIEPAKTFSRTFRGYDPAAVDAYVEALTIKQQLLANDVESLRAGLKERDKEAAALRNEVVTLTDTSSSPHAVQQRMAKMLRRAVDEIAEMHAEARTAADALIARAKAEAEAEQCAHEEVLADMVAKQRALAAEYAERKKALDAELAEKRAEARTEIEAAWGNAQQAVNEANEQRIKVLEQLMGVYRDLEAVPATLESAYQEAKNSPEAGGTVSVD